MRTSIWRGSISFGLINIPIAVQSAEKDRGFHFNLLDERTLSPIRFKRVNAKTGEVVPGDKIVKGYQYQRGKYVLMSDADFKNANPKAMQTLEIQDFIKISDIDILLCERPYYLVPEKGGAKGYSLLAKALEETDRVALAKMVMHTKGHLTCIFSRGGLLVLEIMRFAHEVITPQEFQKRSNIKINAPFSAAELKMATRLVNEMTAPWKPSEDKYKDTYYLDLKKHIDAKIKAGKGKTIETVVQSEPVQPTPAGDLMSLLKASLEKTGSKEAPAASASEIPSNHRARNQRKRKTKHAPLSRHLH